MYIYIYIYACQSTYVCVSKNFCNRHVAPYQDARTHTHRVTNDLILKKFFWLSICICMRIDI